MFKKHFFIMNIENHYIFFKMKKIWWLDKEQNLLNRKLL